MDIKLTGYKDSTGKEYKVGDIVLNPFFGDYWVVQENTKEQKEQYGFDTDYCLALYNNRDDYCIDITEPAGFKIIVPIDDKDYNDVLDEVNKIAKRIQQEREELDNELATKNKEQ